MREKGRNNMGDDIEISDIQIIQDGLFQIDFYNKSKDEHYRAFCDPDKFFKMIGDSMQDNHIKCLKEHSERLEKDNE